LSNQGIIELGPLKDFVNLETLDLSGNEITNLEAIESIISLKNINLSENPALTDLSSLAGLTAIEELRISATAVATIVDLANFSEMTVFEAAANQIIDVSPLATLQKLTSLDLSQNPINRTEATCPAVSVPTALANFCLEGVTVAYNPHIQKLIGLHCLGCHPDYGTEAGIIAEAQLANTAIANGTMPMGADPLSATDMAIFNQWFLSLPPATPAPAQ
jgi:Leucine-rich repeat (LRR) protein